MRRAILALFLALFLAALAIATPFGGRAWADDATPPEWRLVWSDEFDGDALDPARWRARVTPDYHPLGDTDFLDTRRHLRVEDGVLKLIARRAPLGRYTSAMVETQDIAAWRYGRFEARIRVPKGKGTNAAFWMMHRDPTTEPWPLGGEIDIVEQLGRQPHRVYGTLHFKGAERIKRGGVLEQRSPFHENFHVFALEWTPAGFAWFVDGAKYHEITARPPSENPERPDHPFDRPFFLMLSNVIGGKWPGEPGLFARWPKVMEVDWVRVYQRDEPPAGSGEPPQTETTR
jgi:beta-glucanase (GH16 family)